LTGMFVCFFVLTCIAGPSSLELSVDGPQTAVLSYSRSRKYI